MTKNNGTLGRCSWVPEGYCCSVGARVVVTNRLVTGSVLPLHEYCCHVGNHVFVVAINPKKHERLLNNKQSSSPHVVVLKDRKYYLKQRLSVLWEKSILRPKSMGVATC